MLRACGDIQAIAVGSQRGKAWAFQQAMGVVWYYVESNPSTSQMGRRTLERTLADGA
ncbi:MAG TPA: hypothetical protein VKQ30_20265 [Ktedonobacterales bacterium]|nr:hypothetical protein [Ktedonobacterales bacterium]